MSNYLAKYECVECGHEEFYDSDLKMGEDFCAYCEECTSDLKLVPRQVDAVVSVRDYLKQIKGSRKGSIGSINNVYLPQLGVKKLDDLLEELNEYLEKAH